MKVPMVGEQLGRYEITRVLGTGAMGEVFAAYDETLDREVALKVLRPQFSDDFERRERFEREAKAIAALDHPNIVTIYSVEEDAGAHFLTMQLVDGQTLDALIPEDGLPIDAFLNLALRLVEAVAAAHQKGIVHRDLKPSNVMVAEDGRLKVLDFGLAKLRSADTAAAVIADPDTIGLTLEGQIIGTVAYMSPEQAEGREADHRSDIFSLGVLLYEMATGDAPFQGDTPISVMSSIIKDTPSLVTQIKPGMPAHLSRIVRACMAKDPMRRYQSAIDLRNALDDLKYEVQSGEFEAASGDVAGTVAAFEPVPRRRTRPGGLVTAVLFAVVAFAAGALLGGLGLPSFLSGPSGRDAGQPELSRLTSQTGVSGSPTWSPDGTDIVYASDVSGSLDLWHQDAEGRLQQITAEAGSESDPDWAPDNTSVAYAKDFGNNGISIIPPHAGGQPTQITSFGTRPRWAPDSSRLVFQWRGDIWVVEAQTGAEPVRLVSDTAGAPQPVWSHDGNHVYFWNRTSADVLRINVETREQEALGLTPTGQEVVGIAAARDGGSLVISRGPYGGNKDLWKVLLDGSGHPAGEQVRLTLPVTDDVDPALSPDGTRLAYAARHVVRHLYRFVLDERGRGTSERQQITAAADSNYYPALSTDGTQLVWTAHSTSDQGMLYSMQLDEVPYVENKLTTNWVRGDREIGGTFTPDGTGIMFTSTKGGSYELWLASCVAGCVPTPVTRTEHPVRDVMPTFTPGGDRVVYASNQAGSWDVWSLPIGNGNGSNPERLTESLDYEMYPALSPSGERIAYWTNRGGGGGDIWVMGVDGSNPEPLVVNEAQEGFAAWSPDERFLYFASDRSGSFNIWAHEMATGAEFSVTQFDDLDSGLPESVILSRLAVGPGFLVVPVEERSAGLWVLGLQ